MLKPRYRSNQLICGIDGAPFTVAMLVVVVTLLVIGMTTPQPYHSSTSIDLPKVSHPISMWQADRRKAMLIAVSREGKVFFRSDPVGVEQLPAKIREGVIQGAERKVYIRADRRAKYGWVAEVLDSVRSAGIEKIGFLVEQRRTPIPDQ